MPELPEVETIARALRSGGRGGPGTEYEAPSLIGMAVQTVDLSWPRTLAVPDVEEFSRRLPGQIVKEVSRRGKYLLIQMSQDWLIFHLRMSGDLYLEPAQAPMAAHHRLVIWFEGGWRLAFNDPRKFGRVWLTSDPEDVLEGLGPEPLEESFTADQLYEMLQVRSRQLKPLLLDQSFLAGVGNIYADEALHRARLHPLQVSNQVDRDHAAALWEAVRAVLEEGILRQGSSIDWVYRGGDFQNTFRVYQKTGEPCPNCGTPIQRIVVGQRSSHFCPFCQALD